MTQDAPPPDQPPRRQTGDFATLGPYAPAIAPEATRLSVDIKLAVVIALGLLGGGAAAGSGYMSMTTKVALLEERLGGVATKMDLSAVKGDITGAIRARLGQAIVRCPGVTKKGESWIDCKLIIMGADQ